MTLAQLAPLRRSPAEDAHGRRVARIAEALLLLAVFAVSYYLRCRYWIVAVGLESSYQDWASRHYFGGIAATYLSNADLLLQGRVAELSRAYPPGYRAVYPARGAIVIASSSTEPTEITVNHCGTGGFAPPFARHRRIPRRTAAKRDLSAAGRLG
jgi:hypothetical protein